ncbi:uncharacterized protein LOC144821377 [Lissotriton helveticus]
MGCRCCRMIQCYAFEVEGPPNGNINEGNKNSEHNNHIQNPKQQPQVHQPQPNSEGLKNLDITKIHLGFHDANGNADGGGTEKWDSKGNGVLCTSYGNVNTGLFKEFSEEGHTVVLDLGREFHITSGISQESLLGKQPDLETYTNRTLVSDEPESLQDEICQSIEGNSSLTESAILDIRNDTVSQQNTHYLNDCYETDSVKSGNMALSTGHNNSRGTSLESIESVDPKVDFRALDQSFHPVNWLVGIDMIEGPTETYKRREAAEDEDIDPDVAEALAALAAATAGEDEEEEDFNGENGY